MAVGGWVAGVAALTLLPAAFITLMTWRAAAHHWMGPTYLGKSSLILLSIVLDGVAWLTGDSSWLVVDFVMVRPLGAAVMPGVTLVYWQGVKRGGQIATE